MSKINTCLKCGKVFVSPRTAKYCSKKCNDACRKNAKNKEQRLSERAEIIKLYHLGLSAKDVSKRIGVSEGWIISIWHSENLPKQLTKKQKKLKELRESGLCCSEIADILGMRCNNVRQAVNNIGMSFTEIEKKYSQRLGHIKKNGSIDDRKEKSREYIETKFPEWEYLSGFISSDDFLKLRCRKCGTELEKSAVSARHAKTLVCSTCIEQSKSLKIQNKQMQKMLAFWEHDFIQASFGFKTCTECGNLFFPENKRQQCCSSKCRKRRQNRKREHRIDRAEIIDNTITLEKLFKRDKGICWLCARECDWSNCSRDGETVIVHGMYPSIDHVIPLAKGGNHTWDNVRLAHHYCNSLKSDKVVS